MDKIYEMQKKTEKAQEKDSPQEKREKISLNLKVAEEKSLQFDEQTFDVKEDAEKGVQEDMEGSQPQQSSYLQTFENKTVSDIMREDAERQAAEMKILEKQKESLAEDALDPNMTIEAFQKRAKENLPIESTNLQESKIQEKDFQGTQENSSVIEKPNYDLLQERKTIKLSKKSEKKKRFSKKTAGIALACALAGSAVICVGNAVLIDQMSSSFVQIDETYKFNLAKYLKSINNLDATKKSMDFLETYPDDVLNAGDLGAKSNWFDRLCNFLGGLFGG